jgi:hypothetical protein
LHAGGEEKTLLQAQVCILFLSGNHSSEIAELKLLSASTPTKQGSGGFEVIGLVRASTGSLLLDANLRHVAHEEPTSFEKHFLQMERRIER